MHRAPVPFLLLFIIDAKRFIIDTDRWPELFSVNQKKKAKKNDPWIWNLAHDTLKLGQLGEGSHNYMGFVVGGGVTKEVL